MYNLTARHCSFLLIFGVLCITGLCDLQFFTNGNADAGINTHNILGADFGPAEYDVSGLVIFLEPDQDCDSVLPHSIYNGTVDYNNIGDFVLFWHITHGCPYQQKAAVAEKIGAKALIVNLNELIQYMPPMFGFDTDLHVSIPSIIIPIPDSTNMFEYASERISNGEQVTARIVAENENILLFFTICSYFFGVAFSIEAGAAWVCLGISLRFDRTRNERLSFMLAALQTTVQAFFNWADFWNCRNYFPREVNIILWGLCIYLAFVEVYWFFWVWYTVLIRGTIYRNRYQYNVGKAIAIIGTAAHGICEVVRWTFLSLGTDYADTMAVWRGTLVPFIVIVLSLFAGLGYVTFKLRSRLMASIKDMGTNGVKSTAHSLSRVTKIGFPIIAIILALSWSLILWLVQPDVFGVASLTTFMLCFRAAFIYIPVAHLWSILDRWRRENISSKSSKSSPGHKSEVATRSNVVRATNDSAGKTNNVSNIEGDTGSDNDTQDRENDDLEANYGSD